MPTRVAQSLRMLHAGPRFLTDFNMFRLTAVAKMDSPEFPGWLRDV